MSRDIEFRAWDAKNKEMIHEIGIILERDRYLHDIFQDENLAFMQYTGLKDKSGTKIYEGDVVNKNYMSSPGERSLHFVGLVMWDDYLGRFIIVKGKDRRSPCVGMPYDRDSQQGELEVIGNIYEHPSLLAESKHD